MLAFVTTLILVVTRGCVTVTELTPSLQDQSASSQHFQGEKNWSQLSGPGPPLNGKHVFSNCRIFLPLRIHQNKTPGKNAKTR